MPLTPNMHLWSRWAPEARAQQLGACGVYKYLKLDVNMRLGRELGRGLVHSTAEKPSLWPSIHNTS